MKTDGLTQEPGVRHAPVKTWTPEGLVSREDCIASEVPVALVYNGIAHVVMMATPDHLREFAWGFSLTEGIIQSASEIYDIELTERPEGYEVNIELASRCFQALKEKRRTLVGRSGCGLCGAETLAQIRQDLPQVIAPTVSHQAVQRALAHLQQHQPLQQQTGAVHGAAWCSPEGGIKVLFEDVGRHNALDKLIGHRLQSSDSTSGFVLVSSRASYEMVQKCALAGIGMLVSVSAATDMAVKLAGQCSMRLIGFARTDRHVIYTIE